MFTDCNFRTISAPENSSLYQDDKYLMVSDQASMSAEIIAKISLQIAIFTLSRTSWMLSSLELRESLVNTTEDSARRTKSLDNSTK